MKAFRARENCICKVCHIRFARKKRENGDFCPACLAAGHTYETWCKTEQAICYTCKNRLNQTRHEEWIGPCCTTNKLCYNTFIRDMRRCAFICLSRLGFSKDMRRYIMAFVPIGMQETQGEQWYFKGIVKAIYPYLFIFFLFPTRSSKRGNNALAQ